MLNGKSMLTGAGLALALGASPAMAVDPGTITWDQTVDINGFSYTGSSEVTPTPGANLRLTTSWANQINVRAQIMGGDVTLGAIWYEANPDIGSHGARNGGIALNGATLTLSDGILISGSGGWVDGTIAFGSNEGVIVSRNEPSGSSLGTSFRVESSGEVPDGVNPAVLTGTGGMRFIGETNSHRARFIGNANSVGWTGETVVESGIVRFDGDHALSSNDSVVVESGGTLRVDNTQTVEFLTVNGGQVKGDGTINSAVNFTGGTFGGGSPDGADTLDIVGDVSFSGDGTYAWRVDDSATGMVAIDGVLALDGAADYSVVLDELVEDSLVAGQYTLVSTTGGVTGFSAGNWSADLGAGWSGSSVSQDGDDIVLNVVPEPASLALLGAGGLLCLWRRRRIEA